ncbi:hypothetical protein KU73_06270 [Pectobacterium wasabiae]|uniref:Transposase n=1 Tax=Pectobacterium wasabiae TaxID=55208 RepID=A0AAW3ENM3_9GAMM|nr:hypothetical protein A7983_16955 [Pectobacterium wasabiae CFBP 3304]KFX09821.1 hypothetical protein JV38_02545 [Pectobacterium wasabiae]KGA30023.1 hypothetical protein KU73_06270 [Pectobacterium wasabiae]
MVFSFCNELLSDYSLFVKCSGKPCISQLAYTMLMLRQRKPSERKCVLEDENDGRNYHQD